MPNRIIKESCRTSPDLAKLSHGAERLCWRMITVCDDQGRFDACPKVLLGACFPLLIGRVTERNVRSWLVELERAGLIVLYVVSGRSYGFFRSWAKHQRIYGCKSKYPDPPETASPQSAGSCGDFPQVPEDPGSYPISEIRESRSENRESREVPARAPKSKAASELPADWVFNERHQALADGLGLNIHAEGAKFRDYWQAKGEKMKDWDAAFRTWLNRAKEFAK